MLLFPDNYNLSRMSQQPHLVSRMCQITGCSEAVAAKLLDHAGHDLGAAVDMFYCHHARIREQLDRKEEVDLSDFLQSVSINK